jgi:hypothetical protein
MSDTPRSPFEAPAAPPPLPSRENLAAAAEQLRAAPGPGTAPPSEADVAAGLAAAQAGAPRGVTQVDVDALMGMIQGLQDQLNSLQAEKDAGDSAPVLGTASSLRDLIKVHAAHNPGTDHADVLRLADDAVDAATNAQDSGDGSIVGDIAGKIARALHRVHPGPGDHHYFRQALGFAEVHLPDAAAQLRPRPPQAAAAITSDRAPATVVQGSVTG